MKGKKYYCYVDETGQDSEGTIFIVAVVVPVKSFYSVYLGTKEYKSSTILTIAKAISSIENYSDCEFTVLVDALSEKDQRYYGSQLRRLKLPVRKIRGIRKDENSAIIRLADSLCGFVRDIKENNLEDNRGMVNLITEV